MANGLCESEPMPRDRAAGHNPRPLTRTVVALILMAAPAFAQPVSDHQVQVSGQKIHYLEAGSGPA